MLPTFSVSCILLLTSSTIYRLAAGDNQTDYKTVLTVKSEATQSQQTVDTDENVAVAGLKLPTDCSQLTEQLTFLESGVYLIQPLTYPRPFYVYCDMETDGGGWTVFQRRLDGSVGFYRGWTDYKNGFGNINSEYWLGNEKLFYLTAQGNYKLRVDLEDFRGEKRYAGYNKFRLGDEATLYKLMLGSFSGNAGDSLSYHNGKAFTTKDADHDSYTTENCAVRFKGAWWYDTCHESNLNGQYLIADHASYADGVNWKDWLGHYYSLKTTEMKVRK